MRPGEILIGELTKGRVCFDHSGRRMKVLRQNEGSTTIQRPGKLKRIGTRSFTPKETITISRSTIVRLTKEAQS